MTTRAPIHDGVREPEHPQPDVIADVDYMRCDRDGCTRRHTLKPQLPRQGSNETEAAFLRRERACMNAAVLHAESIGWQCVLVDGKPMHFCRDHVNELLPPRVRFDPDGKRVRR